MAQTATFVTLRASLVQWRNEIMRRAQFPFPMDYDRKKMTASLRLVGNTAGKNTLHLINGEGRSSGRRCYIIRDVLMQNRWSNRHCYRGRQVEEGPCKSLIIIRLCCLRAKTCLARTCRYLAVVYRSGSGRTLPA